MLDLQAIQNIVAKVSVPLRGFSGVVNPDTGIREDAVLLVPGADNYDPENETYTHTYTEVPVTAFMSDYDQTEINDINVKEGDQRAMLLAPLPPYEISQEFRFKCAGRDFHVVSINVDPARSIMLLQLRGVGRKA